MAPNTRKGTETTEVRKDFLQNLKDEKTTLEKEKKRLAGDLRAAHGELKEKEVELKSKEAELALAGQARDRYKRDYDSLLLKMQSKRKKGKTTKYEQSDDIVKFIGAYVKDYLFRNVKFTPTTKQLQAITKKVWDGIKGKHKLEQAPINLKWDEFHRIYAPVVASEISDRRQYTQTRGQAAAKGEISWMFLRLIVAIALSRFGLLTQNLLLLLPHFPSLLGCPYRIAHCRGSCKLLDHWTEG